MGKGQELGVRSQESGVRSQESGVRGQALLDLFNLQNKDRGNKVLVLLDQAIVSGGNFLLAIVLIRSLGLENYGLFAMLWLGLLFVLSLHQAFFTKPMMTLAIKKSLPKRITYFKSLWQIQLISFLLVGGLIVGICQFPLPFPTWINYIPFMVGITILYLLQDFLKKTFFINKKYVFPILMDSLLYGILFIGLLILHYLGKSSVGNTLGILLVAYFVSIVSSGRELRYWYKTRSPQPATHSPQLATLKIHYHFSSWLLGTSILQWFTGNFFLVATAGILGTTAVGAVRMAQNLVGLCNILFLAMENVVPTEAAQHFLKNGPTNLVNHLTKSSKQIGTLVAIILLGMSLTAPFLIPLLYGQEYATYCYVVWGYCFLYIFVFLGYPFRYYFRTLQITKPIFIAYVLGSGFSLIAAFPLINTWGILGLLTGLIISQILTLLCYLLYFINLRQSVRIN